MAIWLVKATWIEDDVEASDQWEVNAVSVPEAVRDVTSRLRFRPHHVEAKLVREEARTTDLLLGQVRRVPPPS
jgi:hypothetical protein